MRPCKMPPVKVPYKVDSLSRSKDKCSSGELLRNGGFEKLGVLSPFAYWRQEGDLTISPTSLDVYEGVFSALFSSFTTDQVQRKTARLFQSVPVPPGCFLVLSFAENFLRPGTDFNGLTIRARVSYEEGNNPVDLIELEVNYQSFQGPTGVYTFHQRVADIPVPPHVCEVTVEFFVSISDSGPLETLWALDGVSLRAN